MCVSAYVHMYDYTCSTVQRCIPLQRASIITDSTGPTNISHASTVPMFVAVVILEALSPLVAFVTCGCSSL